MIYKEKKTDYNVNSKVNNFGEFCANWDAEKEKLKGVKRSFKPNSDIQNFTTNTRNEFDEVTRKITQFTLGEVDDKLKGMEETEEELNEDRKESVWEKVVRKLKGVSDKQLIFNMDNDLPWDWRGSKEGYYEKMEPTKQSKGSN